MPGGRPTKYKEEFCQIAMDLMKDGASKIEVCAKLDIGYDAFLDYQTKHPEFSEAIKKGELLSQAWWEEKGRTGLEKRYFNYTGWFMNMKNRFRNSREKWADKVDHEHNGGVTLKFTNEDEKCL